MENIQKFQDLLKKLFQFEASDLDFGIYRILNYKRDRIEKFIQEDLVNKVEEAFTKHKDERLTNINQRFESAKEKIIQSLGKEAFTPIGELKEEFKNTPLGRDFLTINAQKEEAEKIDEIKLQVFNDLYNFFSRYYEEGDFVPQYRYSIKSHKYAIPYNGEEVKLYWANSEQYYTKTGLLFRDYTFKINDYKVIFRTVSAEEELGSNKATKERFFVLDDEMPVELQDKTVIICFQYRELTDKEVKRYVTEGGSNTGKQEKINQISYEEILKEIKDAALKGFLIQAKNEKPLLLYQISRFTSKNTKDYFIHKNLKKFLTEQLDYFIKAEVLDIETLEHERFLDKHITRAKVVREIGEDIIDFLSQIEDFQKRLWEKKKFVLRTEYVITTDRVPEEFYDEIWTNEEQRKEWQDLGFETPTTKEELKNRKLPIDTKYFTQEFKEKLLEKLTENADLDDLLDGLLIKSENWQALNLLLEKYKEKVQTVYIDSPFNTGKDFLYKDKFRNSSWLCLMENRLSFVRTLLKKSGTFYLHLDENANYYGKILLNNLNFDNIQEIVFNTNATKDEEADLFGYKSFGNRFVLKHNTIFYCFNNGCFFRKLWKPNRNTTKLNIGWLDLIAEDKTNNPQKIEDFNFYIENYGEKGKLELMKIDVNEKIFPLGDMWTDIYSFTQSEMRTSENVSFLTQKPENLLRRILQTSSRPDDIILDYFAGSGTTLVVAQKLGRKWIGVEMGEFFNEFYKDVNKGEIKLGVLGRLKIILYGDKEFIAVNKSRHSHLSKDIKWQGGGFFKYHYLEQYEDVLENIELKENIKAQELFKDEYLLKYFLEFETRESSYLLNIDHLKNPFAYKLKVNLSEVGEPQEMVVDVPETFNYLLGLKVKKIKARGIATHPSDARNDKKRKYLFILGEKEGKDYAIVWREYDDNWSDDDFKKDKEFIVEELSEWKPYIVYVNGQSVLSPKNFEVRVIEPEFKRLMEG